MRWEKEEESRKGWCNAWVHKEVFVADTVNWSTLKASKKGTFSSGKDPALTLGEHSCDNPFWDTFEGIYINYTYTEGPHHLGIRIAVNLNATLPTRTELPEGTFSQESHLPLWQHPSLSMLYLHPLKEMGNFCSAELDRMSGYIPLWVYTALLSAGVSLAGKVDFAVLECCPWSWHTFGKGSFQPLLRPACSPYWEPCSWCLVSLMVPRTIQRHQGKVNPGWGRAQEFTAPSHSTISSREGLEMRHHTREHQHGASPARTELCHFRAVHGLLRTMCVDYCLVWLDWHFKGKNDVSMSVRALCSPRWAFQSYLIGKTVLWAVSKSRSSQSTKSPRTAKVLNQYGHIFTVNNLSSSRVETWKKIFFNALNLALFSEPLKMLNYVLLSHWYYGNSVPAVMTS